MIVLKDITYKIDKLELRRTKGGKDLKYYYEIVEYLTSDTVYTIAIFRYNEKENLENGENMNIIKNRKHQTNNATIKN